MKTCLPNIRKFDDPPAKKAKVAKAAPEFHIAVNLAPTPGGPPVQGMCIVSSTPFPVSTSTPGPSLIEEVSSLDSDIKSCDALNTVPLGHSVYLSKACKMLIRMLSKSAETDRAPLSYDVLTWMDAENSEVDGLYMHSFSNFLTFKIKDALGIMGTRVHVLMLFGYLGQGGTLHLHQCTWDRVLILLGLWTMMTDSIGMVEKPLNIKRLFQW